MASKVEILTGSLKGSIIGNAASEETLQEILKALQSTTGSGQQGQGQSAQISKTTSQLDSSIRSVNTGLTAFGSALGTTTRLLSSGSTSLGEWTKGLSSAVSNIPVVGKFIGGLGNALGSGIQVLEGWNKTLKDVSSNGASFNNSITEMRLAAAASKMTLVELQSVIKSNSQGFAELGGTVTQGVKSFTMLSGEVMKAGGIGEKLMNMGFSVEEINGGMARYLTTVHRGTKVNSENVGEMSKKYAEYATHLDKISKLTGENRAELEKANDQIKQEAAWKMKLATATAEEREKMVRALDTARAQFGETGAQAMKDRILNGQAMQESSRIFEATVPEAAMVFDRAMNDVKDSSVKAKDLTKNMEDGFAKNADAVGQRIKDLQPIANAMSGGIAHSAASMGQVLSDVATSQLRYADKDGKMTQAAIETKMSAAEQEQASRNKLTESLNAAEIGFRNLHAAIMEQVLGALEKFVNHLNISGSSITDVFNKVIAQISTAGVDLEAAFNKISDFIQDNFGTVLIAAGVAVAAFTAKVVVATAEFVAKIAMGIMSFVRALGPVGLIVTAITGLVYIFTKLGGDFEVFQLGLAYLGAGIKQIGNGIMYAYHWIMNKLTPGDSHKKEMEKIDLENAEIVKDKERILTEMQTKMAQNRAKQEEEDLAKKKERTERDAELDKRRADIKQKELDSQAAVKRNATEFEQQQQAQAAVPIGVKGLLEQIAKGEGTSDEAARKHGLKSGYDVSLGYGAYGGGPKKPLSEMTMAEVKEYQKAMLADPNNKLKSSAVGKYQFISGTLAGLQKEMGLKDTDKFDAATQEKMGELLLKRRGLDKYVSGKMSAEQFQLGLAQEWASVADPRTGQGYYPGQRNAHTTDAMAKAAIAGLAKQQAQPATATTPEKQLPSNAELAKQESEKRLREKEEADRQRSKTAQQQEAVPQKTAMSEEKGLSEVVSLLSGVNTKLAVLLDQNKELSEKQIRSIRSNSGNIYEAV